MRRASFVLSRDSRHSKSDALISIKSFYSTTRCRGEENVRNCFTSKLSDVPRALFSLVWSILFYFFMSFLPGIYSPYYYCHLFFGWFTVSISIKFIILFNAKTYGWHHCASRLYYSDQGLELEDILLLKA